MLFPYGSGAIRGSEMLRLRHMWIDADGGLRLRRMAFRSARQGRSVIPICPYASAYIRRNPEFLECVREDYRAALRI